MTPGGGGGNYHKCTGSAIFWDTFFKQKINFGVSVLVKSQVVINFGWSF